MTRIRTPLAAPLLLIATLVLRGVAARAVVLDTFEQLTGWSAHTSAGASAELAQDSGRSGMGLRIDFDFHGGGGYVIARKAFPVTVPPNYAFTFQMRGAAPPNGIEFKVIDQTGDNVWWFKQPRTEFSARLATGHGTQAPLELRLGPGRAVAHRAGSAPSRSPSSPPPAAAARCGSTTCNSSNASPSHRRTSRRRSAPRRRCPTTSRARRSTPTRARPGTAARSPTTSGCSSTAARGVRSAASSSTGIPTTSPPRTRVQLSEDGTHWTEAYRSDTGNGRRDYIYLPDAEARWLRLDFTHSSRGHGYGIRSLTLKPFEFSASPNQFFSAIAAEMPPGLYPKYFLGQQTYWTVVGGNGGDREALLNEEGMLEVDNGGFSIEPFLFVDGTLVTWNAVRTTQELDGGYLPIPSVTWHHDPLSLTVTAVAAGPPGADTLHVRYRVETCRDGAKDAVLFLAIRPFQVLPPWQTLNLVGGVTPIHEIAFDARTVLVNGTHRIISATPADRHGAATFEEGLVVDLLREGKVPPRDRVRDPLGYASGVLGYGLTLGPHEHDDVYLAVPFQAAAPDVTHTDSPATAFDAALDDTRRAWETVLSRVDFRVPPPAQPYVDTLKSTLAYMLVNRDGAALQPGSRTYARSWIRDGALQLRGAVGAGLPRDRPRIPRLVRAAPVRRRHGAVLHRPARRRPRARARQRRRVPLHRRRVLSLHARRRLHPRPVAVAGPRGRLPRHVAAHTHDCGVPTAGHAGLFRPPAGVDQSRRVLVASGAFVLGRLLRAARAQGCRTPRRRHGRHGQRHALRRAARRVPPRPVRVDRAHDRRPSPRLHSGVGRTRRLRPDVDRDCGDPVRRAGQSAGPRAGADVRQVLRERPGAPAAPRRP